MQRLVCLDGLRGVLALYVAISHMAPFADLPRWCASLLSHGGAAVDMFFMLSGLVIVRSLESFCWQARPFLIARVTRIFPAYLLMLAFALVVQTLPCGFETMSWVAADSQARGICSEGWPLSWGPELLAHLTMLHGIFPATILPNAWVSFLGAAWSLSTEWQFYLLTLLLGWAGSRHRSLPRLMVVFLLLSVAGQAWQWLAPSPWLFSRAFLPNKAQYFALGIASAGLLGARGGPRYGAVLAATLAVSGWDGGADKLLAPLLWTLCLAAQLRPAWPGLSVLAWGLRCRPMLWLGGVSYSLYLTNEPIQKVLGLVLAGFANGNALRFTLLWVPLGILLPLLVATWLHRAVEGPALRWGRDAARQVAQGRGLESEGVKA